MKIDELVKEKIRLHDLKTKLDALYDEKKALLAEKIAILNGQLMEFLNETGQNESGTKYGTVYRTVRTRFNIIDSDLLANWVKKTGRYDVYTKALSSTVVRDLVDGGVEVAGVTREQYYALSYRRYKNESV